MYLEITGLLFGFLAVVVGQVAVFTYHSIQFMTSSFIETIIQSNEFIKNSETIINRNRSGIDNFKNNFQRPEGFLTLVLYLGVAWILEQLPSSYYSFDGKVNWLGVIVQLLVSDFFIYMFHLSEHKVTFVYKCLSKHYMHHQVDNPTLFDAFRGDMLDTFYMILIPLHLTTMIVPMMFVPNVWTYMAFGSVFAAHLVLIHSSYQHSWDFVFYKLGIVTPAFHHIHHTHRKFNYGHIFQYWDYVFGTHKSPQDIN